jgi:hypothetical protein
MQTHFLSLVITAQLLLQPISALVTLQTIRNLTTLTDECKDRIVESGNVMVDGMARVLGGVQVGQVVLDGGGDEEEVEDVSCSYFLFFVGGFGRKCEEKVGKRAASVGCGLEWCTSWVLGKASVDSTLPTPRKNWIRMDSKTSELILL